MRNKIFIVHYKATDSEHNLVKQGKIRVKKCYNAFDAQCKLENYLKDKNKLIQMH